MTKYFKYAKAKAKLKNNPKGGVEVYVLEYLETDGYHWVSIDKDRLTKVWVEKEEDGKPVFFGFTEKHFEVNLSQNVFWGKKEAVKKAEKMWGV